MKISKLAVFCSFAVLLYPLFGHAESTDVLVLKNGDRITGEITRIWDAEITIEPDYADEFSVDLEAVAHIESEREFEIDLADGRELVVTFPGADAEGNQLARTDTETVLVPLAQLLELDEPEDYYDWESFVDLSGDLKKGNTETRNTKLRADTTLKLGDHRHIAEVTFFKEELAGVSTKDQTLINYNYNWLFSDPWFLGAIGSFERDPIIKLNSRVTASVGIGRDIWDTPRRALNFQLGFGLQAEDIEPDPGDTIESSSNNGVATWVLRFRHDFFGDDLELFHNHSITSNISGRTNTTIKTTTGLRYEITDLLYANFSVDYDHQSHPADGVKRDDIVTLFGLGLEF